MSESIISVENLSKAYRLGMKEEIPDTFVGAATSWLKAPLRNWQRLKRLNTFDEPAHNSVAVCEKEPPTKAKAPAGEILWRLRDVSFEVTEGEVVGIIGRNGAGKSTLLKILSRITEPTHGRAVIRGRVSSLLEVGTGFHPELTGRENIYMNGTILGMRKKEIDQKFDEIVDFSGVEKFLDTPIKRYSSGMQVRLAFAVAAHLEPEILIIDEVLAVGDADFQKKCLGKMQDVAQSGRTVLFVSHNMAVLQAICDRGVFLTHGTPSYDGAIEDAVQEYLSQLQTSGTQDVSLRTDRQGCGRIRLSRISISMSPDSPTNVLVMGKPAVFEFEISHVLPGFDLHFFICDQHGTVISNLDTSIAAPQDERVGELGNTLRCQIEELPLRSGRYFINVVIMHNRELKDHVQAAAWFDVENAEYRGRFFAYPNAPGLVCIDHRWFRPSETVS